MSGVVLPLCSCRETVLVSLCLEGRQSYQFRAPPYDLIYLNHLLQALAPETVIMKFRASTYRFWGDTIQLITNGDLGRCVGRRRRGKAGKVSKDKLHSSGRWVPRAHRAGRCLPLARRNHSEETGTLLAFAFHSGTPSPIPEKAQ